MMMRLLLYCLYFLKFPVYLSSCLHEVDSMIFYTDDDNLKNIILTKTKTKHEKKIYNFNRSNCRDNDDQPAGESGGTNIKLYH